VQGFGECGSGKRKGGDGWKAEVRETAGWAHALLVSKPPATHGKNGNSHIVHVPNRRNSMTEAENKRRR